MLDEKQYVGQRTALLQFHNSLLQRQRSKVIHPAQVCKAAQPSLASFLSSMVDLSSW
jgi:hypothetical protein